MIPLWKTLREMRRVVTQLNAVVWSPVEMARRHLQAKARKQTSIVCQGNKHIAIYVVFQPKGLCATTFETVGHLSEKGFAVVVMSNAPLSSADRERLEMNALHVDERPNFGYDFGGYKDGIKALPNMGTNLDSLLLINDSIWFPAVTNPRLIDDMRDHPADVVAAQIFNDGSAGCDERKTPVLGSYMILLKRPALMSDGFASFWKNYQMSSNKEVTLRRGERAFSRALMNADLTCAGIYSHARFRQALDGLDQGQLRRCLVDLILLDKRMKRLRLELLRDKPSEVWCVTVREFIANVALRKNCIGLAPIFCIDRLHVEVIKKNNEMLYRAARQQLAEWALDSHRSQVAPEVFVALKKSTAQDRNPTLLQDIRSPECV
jgi:hypothetical protein